jgi:hypothetical protein
MSSIAQNVNGTSVQAPMPDLTQTPLAATYTEALAMILGELQAKYPGLADILSMANAVLIEQRLTLDPDRHGALVRSQDGSVTYHVDAGLCDCPDATRRAAHVCKHRYALRMHQMVLAHLAMAAPGDAEEGAPPEEPLATSSTPDRRALTLAHIPRHYIVTIQDKPYIKCNGLVDLAQQHGLVELSTTVITVTPDFAVCQCVARFADGRIFTDIGDATPENVKSHLKDHFIRIAATRATARALRRALNIDMVAVEELGEEERSATQRHRKAA